MSYYVETRNGTWYGYVAMGAWITAHGYVAHTRVIFGKLGKKVTSLQLLSTSLNIIVTSLQLLSSSLNMPLHACRYQNLLPRNGTFEMVQILTLRKESRKQRMSWKSLKSLPYASETLKNTCHCHGPPSLLLRNGSNPYLTRKKLHLTRKGLLKNACRYQNYYLETGLA